MAKIKKKYACRAANEKKYTFAPQNFKENYGEKYHKN
jgi:hypothetical protein